MKKVDNAPKEITTSDLYSRAYMGDTVFIDGKKKTWLQLKNNTKFQWFDVESVTTNGVTNTFNVKRKLCETKKKNQSV